MTCSCGCHVYDADSRIICYSCECQYDVMPDVSNTVDIEELKP